MQRYFYSNSISSFIEASPEAIVGHLAMNSGFADEVEQKLAWLEEIRILKASLSNREGQIFFEYSIPRMGERADVILILDHALYVLEFKVGQSKILQTDLEQVWNYALDFKNFHETSHDCLIAPILIPTEAKNGFTEIFFTAHNDHLLHPVSSSVSMLKDVIENVLAFSDGVIIDSAQWSAGRYSPTPTIIEAATALYGNHTVDEISRSDATAKNISDTSSAVAGIIQRSKENSEKAICFVTGVPGSGKTLVGLNIAIKHLKEESGGRSVYLSGNGPLVSILREALTRDTVAREKARGKRISKKQVYSKVKLFIQNVHNYRDDYLIDSTEPFDHVAIFDEAQRAWNHQQTANFMKRKKNRPGFTYSEPEFLISCLDRHQDWAVVVCLVGGGQEINTGEAGISEWIDSINRSFAHWKVYVSSRLTDSEYATGKALKELENRSGVVLKDDLHLSVSLRSFRAENLSALVKNILDINVEEAKKNLEELRERYPIVITRDLAKAKQWLKTKARGSERYGIVVSSHAERLKPHAIDVKSPMNPILWFLNGKEDVRSSFYLEDVATEFDVQGLELDWSCVTWDGDFRYSERGWKFFSFSGSKWNNINKSERQLYLKNAYRVLLTRARQGMVIVVPKGSNDDPTRNSEFYDGTFEYLMSIGFTVL